MRKLLIVALLLSAVCLLAICQPLSVLAGSGSGGGSDPCSADPTKYALDTNGDEVVDLSDFVAGLSWFFSGGTAPRVCLDTTDLEANLAQAEAALATAEGERDTAQEERDTAQAALAMAEDALAACLALSEGFTLVETNAQGYDEYTDPNGIRFVHLPGGSFDMGSPEGETGRDSNEGPVHTVNLSPFLIAKYEVKQSEYEAVMTGNTAGLDATPSSATGNNWPVLEVSWDDLHLDDGFLERAGLSLPSEAQWEYASRAGTSGPYAGNGVLADMGWFVGNSGPTIHGVGGKQANQFGLHDMHGNVYEWCQDVYKQDFYADGAPCIDPVSTTGSNRRVRRGGSFTSPAESARSALRSGDLPSDRRLGIGFRPVRPLP